MIQRLITRIWKFSFVTIFIICSLIAFSGEYAIADGTINIPKQLFALTNYERYCLKFPKNCAASGGNPSPIHKDPIEGFSLQSVKPKTNLPKTNQSPPSKNPQKVEKQQQEVEKK